VRQKRLALLIAYALPAATLPCFAGDSFNRGVTLYNHHQYLSAGKQFQRSITLDQNVAESMYYGGNCLVKLGGLEFANTRAGIKNAYSQCIQLAPRSAYAYNAMRALSAIYAAESTKEAMASQSTYSEQSISSLTQVQETADIVYPQERQVYNLPNEVVTWKQARAYLAARARQQLKERQDEERSRAEAERAADKALISQQQAQLQDYEQQLNAAAMANLERMNARYGYYWAR
jgi:hypothetical protein